MTLSLEPIGYKKNRS